MHPFIICNKRTLASPRKKGKKEKKKIGVNGLFCTYLYNTLPYICNRLCAELFVLTTH